WYNGSTNAAITLSAADTYSVQISDSLGCHLNSRPITLAYDTVTVTLPAIQNVPCHGDSSGMFCANPTGTGPFTYLWNNFYTTNCLVTMPPGLYSVTVVDILGCSASASTTVTQPQQLTQNDSVVNASCSNVFDGSIIVTATGGTGAYIYSINGGPIQPSNVFSGLSAGNYMVQVTDSAGCFDTATVVINNSYAITGNVVSQTTILCYGNVNDTVIVSLNGGVPPYQYSINGI